MNPHAKEFVPAHLLKRRQEEGDELADKVGQVGLEETESNVVATGGDPTTTTTAAGEKTTTTTTANNVDNHTTAKSSDAEQSSEQQQQQPQQQQHNQHSNHSGDQHQNHNNTNGERHDLDASDEDRHLLKAGETYCEFNGEQFIIPGEDDEYEPDYPEQPHHQHGRKAAGYDFGNAEDNEDEDVCNAYEQFLDNLPE